MRRLPFISALVTAIAGLFHRGPRKIDLGPLDTPKPAAGKHAPGRHRGGFSRRNKVSRRHLPGSQTWTQWLYAKQAKARLARFGIDVFTSDGKPLPPDPEQVRAMRNARKKERRLDRLARDPRTRFWPIVRRYMAAKYGVGAVEKGSP